MHLLFVIDCLGSGGAQRQMVNLAIGLTKRGHSIEFFLYYPEYDHFTPLLQEAGIHIESVNKKCSSLAPMLRIRSLIKNGKYDAVVAYLPIPSFYAEIARIGLPSTPLVVSERSAYANNRLEGLTWGFQQLHHLASHITVNSHHQRKRMELMFPWMRSKISTIYNGVDLDIFRPPDSESRPGKNINLLVLSSIVPIKNVIGLVRALAYYRDHYQANCVIHWAGKIVPNNEQSRSEFDKANRLIRHLGLEKHWNWLGERRNVSQLLQKCDALILPSFLEGLPNAICEALASGRPVLASNIGDNQHLVTEGETGFLFNPENHEDIAQAIRRFQQLDHEQRASMGRHAREFAKRELSMGTYVGQYESLIYRLLGLENSQ
jgi:glycosyltransferase involved in cell wall biosynthesis